MALNQTIEIYGSTVPKPPVLLEKRNVNKAYGFSFPLGGIDSRKFLTRCSDVKLAKGHLKQLLSTSRGERVMLPSYGTNLRRFLMEPMDQATFSQIKREILESFSRYARGISVNKIQIFPGQTSSNQSGQVLIVKIYCTLNVVDSIAFDITLNIQ